MSGREENALLNSKDGNDYQAIDDGIPTSASPMRVNYDRDQIRRNIHGYEHLCLSLFLSIIYLIYSCTTWVYFLFYDKGENYQYFKSHITNSESFMIGDFCFLFASILTLMQWSCNVDPLTLHRQRRELGACARCSASLGDLLILVLVLGGIVYELIGALDFDHNNTLTLNLFYFGMFANHALWVVMWVLFYFVPTTFLSSQLRLLKVYSLCLIIVSILLCMGYVDMIQYHEDIAEKWSRAPDLSHTSWKLQISGMIVGLTGMSLVAFFANFWMPTCCGPPVTRVTLSIKVVNVGLLMFLCIYVYAAEVFFGWFGLYGTEMSFILACLVVEVNVWQDNILQAMRRCRNKYCGVCGILWANHMNDARAEANQFRRKLIEDPSVNESKSGVVGLTSVDSKDDQMTLSKTNKGNKTLTRTLSVPTEDHTIIKFMDRQKVKLHKEKQSERDAMKTRMQLAERRVNHTNNVIVIGVCFILFAIILVFLYQIIFESIYYLLTMFAFLFIVLLVLFPLKVLLANIINIIGSLSPLDINSKYYSSIEPIPPKKLPHVTIQIPVYTEDLVDVISPTVRDVMKAMKYYRKQGGTCNLFMNDDGLQAKLTKSEIRQRLKFYRLGNIGYVARPKENRAGLFKKASNLNYCIDVSVKTFKKMREMRAARGLDSAGAGAAAGAVGAEQGVETSSTGTDDNKKHEANNLPNISTHPGQDVALAMEPESDEKAGGLNELNAPVTTQLNSNLDDAAGPAGPAGDAKQPDEEEPDQRIQGLTQGLLGPTGSGAKGSKKKPAVNAPVSPLMTEALQEVIKEKNNEFWAGGDITIGDFVLLLDADTRLSEKCIYQTVGEFKDEHVAFTQHHTQSMRYDFNYWENVIAFFTNHVYDIGISEACALGDVSPLVGHNAMLRVSALKTAAIGSVEKGDEREIWWSETHVSEDFECVLRLMKHKFYGRYVTYTTYKSIVKADEWNEKEVVESFMEGVSLTYQDEQIRLRKYAYGCCEIMFNKMSDWPCKGLFSKIFFDFLSSSIPFASKFSILSYMGTYYAMGLAIPLTVFTCLLVSYKTDNHTQNDDLHKSEFFRIVYFLDANINPYDIFLQVTVLFSAYVPFTAAMFYYRRDHQQHSFLKFFYHEIKSCVLMWFFWTSILYPIMTSILMYFFNTKVSWGATRKSIDYTHGYNSLSEFKWVAKANRNQLIFMIILFAGWMLYHQLLDIAWTRNDIPVLFAIWGHIVAPFVLNPIITRLKY